MRMLLAAVFAVSFVWQCRAAVAAEVQAPPAVPGQQQDAADNGRAVFMQKVEAKVAAARKNLASVRCDASAYKTVFDYEHNMVFLSARPEAAVAAISKKMADYADFQWKTLLKKNPSQLLCVVLVTADDWKKIPVHGLGFYDPATDFIWFGDATITYQTAVDPELHEYAHALLEGDFRLRGLKAPDHWYSEGVATLFETFDRTEDAWVPRHNVRLGCLQGQVYAWDFFMTPASTKLIKTPQTLFGAYAEARYILFFLYEHGLLKKFHERYTEDLKAGKADAGTEAVTFAFGKPWQAVQNEWAAWVHNPPSFHKQVAQARKQAMELFRKGNPQYTFDEYLRLLTMVPNDAGMSYNMGCLFSLLGNKAQAVGWLGKAVDLGYNDFTGMRDDADLGAIRGMQGYRDLLRKLATTSPGAKPLAFIPPFAVLGGRPLVLDEIRFVPQKAGNKVTGQVFWRKQGDEKYAALPAEPAGDNRYAVTLPAAATGATFEYYLEMKEDGGAAVTEPKNGPKAPHLVTPDITPPDAVTDLAAPCVKNNRVALRWTPAKDDCGVAEYRIHRGASDKFVLGEKTLLAGTDGGALGFVDSAPTAGQTAWYAVQTVDVAGREGEVRYLKVDVPDKAAAKAPFIQRVNCGGPEVASADGASWEADRDQDHPAFHSLGAQPWAVTGTVKDTGALKDVYQFERWSSQFIEYVFPVEPGRYEVALLFAETNPSFFGAGKRTFDILVNGAKVAQKVDVFAQAGGPMMPWQFKKAVDVTGRTLTIRLQGNPTGPAIKGIEIRGIEPQR